MSKSDEPCMCFPCSLNALLDEHYPEGITTENCTVVMTTVAELVGNILSMAGGEGDLVLNAFLKAVDRYRQDADDDTPCRAEMH